MVKHGDQERGAGTQVNFPDKKEKKKKQINIPVNSRLFLHHASEYEQNTDIKSQFSSVNSYLAEIYKKGLTSMWLEPLTPEQVISELDMKKKKLPEEFSNRVYAAAEADVKFKYDGKNKPVDSVTTVTNVVTGQLEAATLQEDQLPVVNNTARQPEINEGDEAGLSEKVSQSSTVVSKEPQKTAKQTEQVSRITNPEYQEAFNMLKTGRVEGGPDVSLVRAAISKYDEAMRRKNQEPSLDSKIWLIIEAWPDTGFSSEKMLEFLRRKAGKLAAQYRKLKNAPGEEGDYIINGLIDFVSLKALEKGVEYSIEKHGEKIYPPEHNPRRSGKKYEPVYTYDKVRQVLGLPPVKTSVRVEKKEFEKPLHANPVKGAIPPVIQAGEIIEKHLPTGTSADTGGALVSAGHWEKAKSELEFEGRFELAKTRFKDAIFIVNSQAAMLEQSLAAIELDEYKRSEKELQELLPLPEVKDVVQDKSDKNIVTQMVLGYLREQFQKALIRRDVFVASAVAMESDKKASPEEGVVYDTVSPPSLHTAGDYSEVSEQPVHRLGVYGEPFELRKEQKYSVSNNDIIFSFTLLKKEPFEDFWHINAQVVDKRTGGRAGGGLILSEDEIKKFAEGYAPNFNSIAEYTRLAMEQKIEAVKPESKELKTQPIKSDAESVDEIKIYPAAALSEEGGLIDSADAVPNGGDIVSEADKTELTPDQIREALLNNEEFVREVRQQWEEALRSNLKNSNPRYTDEILDIIMPGLAQVEFPDFLNAVIDQHFREESLLSAGAEEQLHANADYGTDPAGVGLEAESLAIPDSAISLAIPDTESRDEKIFNTLLYRVESGRQDIHNLVENRDFINALFRLLNLYSSISDFNSSYSDLELESLVGRQKKERFDNAVQELEKEFYGNFTGVDFKIDTFNDTVMLGRAKQGFLEGMLRALDRGDLEEAKNWEKAFNSFDYHVSESSSQEVREAYGQAKQRENNLVMEANNLEAVLPGAEFEVQGSGGLFKKTYKFTIGEELPGHSEFRTVTAAVGGKTKQFILSTQTLRELRGGVKKFDGKSESPET